MNAPVQPTAAFAPKEQGTQWPSILSAPAPAPAAEHISKVVMAPAPIASPPVVPSLEADTQSEVSSASARNQVSALHEGALRPHEIRSTEEVARRPSTIRYSRRSLYAWWPKWRQLFLCIVSPAAWREMTPLLLRWLEQSQCRMARRRMTSSVLQWLREPIRRVHQRRTNKRLHDVRHRPDWVPILLPYRCWPRLRDTYVAIIVQTTRHRMTASFRWLRQPLSPVLRR